MGKAALLFNGIQYNFAVVEKAVAWATQSKGSLVCLFLRAEQQASEGYIFPSDLDEAENLRSTGDASASHGAVIDSNMRMLEHVLHSNDIDFTATVLTEPGADALKEKLEGCGRIFTSDNVHATGILAVSSIELKSWLKDCEIPVEVSKS